MADADISFDSYQIEYYTPSPTVITQAIIRCFKGSTKVGNIFFNPNGTAIPPSTVGSDGTITFYYEISRFNDVISILRYEKPLGLRFISANTFASIYTGSNEAVGEQEGV